MRYKSRKEVSALIWPSMKEKRERQAAFIFNHCQQCSRYCDRFEGQLGKGCGTWSFLINQISESLGIILGERTVDRKCYRYQILKETNFKTKIRSQLQKVLLHLPVSNRMYILSQHARATPFHAYNFRAVLTPTRVLEEVKKAQLVQQRWVGSWPQRWTCSNSVWLYHSSAA